jgi:hypothetical protein
MGNRAIIRFPDAQLSADMDRPMGVEVYLHWNADDVIDWLKEAAPRMRKGDGSYAAARFVGLCHEKIPGGLSLGIMPINTAFDGVIFSVDCQTGKVKVPSGFGRSFTLKLGAF